MLDRAQGVLIALRRCTVDAAFEEIGRASKRHRGAQVAHRRGAGRAGSGFADRRRHHGRRPLRVGPAVRAGQPVIERFMAFARRVRARYPNSASVRGHIVLVALCGRNEPLSVSSERVKPS